MNNTFEQVFLSDLCGREGKRITVKPCHAFLSDLCGREGIAVQPLKNRLFLSDLCGREEAKS